MNKITKLFFVLAFFSTFSVASNAQISNKNFVGPSVEIGFVMPTITGTSVEYSNDPDKLYDGESNTQPRLAFNYGIPLNANNLVFGFGVSYVPSKTTSSTEEGDQYVEIKNTGSVYFAPTYLVTDATAVYGKLSYNRAKLNHNTDEGNYDEDYNVNVNGVGLGVGIKSFITKDIYIIAELERVNYGNEQTLVEVDNNAFAKTKVTNAAISIGVKF
jgi:hypothetical protein